eukprot:261401-Amphidinium_carterae.1
MDQEDDACEFQLLLGDPLLVDKPLHQRSELVVAVVGGSNDDLEARHPTSQAQTKSHQASSHSEEFVLIAFFTYMDVPGFAFVLLLQQSYMPKCVVFLIALSPAQALLQFDASFVWSIHRFGHANKDGSKTLVAVFSKVSSTFHISGTEFTSNSLWIHVLYFVCMQLFGNGFCMRHDILELVVQ